MLIASLLLALIAPQASKPSAADVSWMTGCWELTSNGRHVIEQWTPVEGGTLLGLSRAAADGRTVEYEFLLIRAGANGLEYVAKPSGQAEATFASTRVTSTEVVFENPSHDFPTRIIYRRDGERLLAAVEGARQGQVRRIEYPYRKARCGGE